MSIILDGLPLSDTDWHAFELSGWLDGPSAERATTGIPGLFGALPATSATGQARTMLVGIRRRPGHITDRPDMLASLMERIQGERRFTTVDRPHHVTYVHCTAVTVQSMSPQRSMVVRETEVRLTLTAYDGASYDAAPRVLKIGQTPVQVPVGTLPSTGLWYVTGAMTSGAVRTIRYTGQNGQEYGAMTLTAPASESLGANDHLELDGMNRSVTKVLANGTRSNAEHWFSGAWFAPDPKHATRARSADDVAAYGRVSITTGVAVLNYLRAWRL
jgi:hypothetical protein